MNNYNVSISHGNRKMGDIPSVSLPPIVTCPHGAPCAAKCYAAKLCRIYPTVRAAYQRNLDILTENPEEYWRQVRDAVRASRFFRFHVSGDIPGYGYFDEMVQVARENPATDILAFTKRYDIVNNYIDGNGELPANLHIIFSRWSADWDVHIKNPHDLPMSAVIFKNDPNPVEYTNICPGNCTECAIHNGGCWSLKRGEIIAFYEH